MRLRLSSDYCVSGIKFYRKRNFPETKIDSVFMDDRQKNNRFHPDIQLKRFMFEMISFKLESSLSYTVQQFVKMQNGKNALQHNETVSFCWNLLRPVTFSFLLI